MSEEKKIKQKSVRFYEEDLEKIAELASELDTNQAELVHQWRRSYERLRQEESDRQGENLKTLRIYMEKIENLFTAMSESTEQIVEDEQNKAIELENQYKKQVLKTKEIREGFESQLKEQKEELERLHKEIKKYEAFEENVEGRIADKDAIIQSKEQNILSLTEEIQELKEKLKKLAAFEEEKILLQNEIEDLKDDLKQKDLDNQKALLDLRAELQNDYAERIQAVYQEQADKRDIARLELEERLRNENQQEIKRIRDEHQREISRIREDYQTQLMEQQERYEQELARTQNENRNEEQD